MLRHAGQSIVVVLPVHQCVLLCEDATALANKWNAGEWTDKETLMMVSVNQHGMSIERLSLVKMVMQWFAECLSQRCFEWTTVLWFTGLGQMQCCTAWMGVISQCNYDLQCQLSWLVWSCSLSWEGDCWGGDQVCWAIESRICVSQLITGNFVIPKAQCNCQFFL